MIELYTERGMSMIHGDLTPKITEKLGRKGLEDGRKSARKLSSRWPRRGMR